MSSFLTDQSLITAFNRGPVTTVFTPPASCLSTLTSFNIYAYYGHIDSAYYDPACYPSSTLDGGASAWDLYYYSPAQCPLGWAHATTMTGNFTGRGSTTLSVRSDTTVVMCCPSGFLAYDGSFFSCYSSFLDTQSTIFYISPVINDNTWYSTDANSPFSTVIGPTSAAYIIYGDGIPVWYQSSDLAAFTAPPKTSSTTTSSPSNPRTTSTPTTSSSTPTNFSPAPTNSTTTSHGLSSGAKIGIGVGIPLGLIAIGLVAFFIYFRRRGMNRLAGFRDKPQLEDTSRPKPPVHELATPDLSAVQDINPDNARDNIHFSVNDHQFPLQGALVPPDNNLPSMDGDVQ